MKTPGLLRIAYKLLVNDGAKFSALLIGISFAVFLMVQMTSMFAGILDRSSATVSFLGNGQQRRGQSLDHGSGRGYRGQHHSLAG
jgi:hypothetical protein